MSKTITIRLVKPTPRHNAPTPQIDEIAMKADLSAEIQKQLEPHLGITEVVLDEGLTFKLTLDGEWYGRKEAEKTIMDVFGEVMENFDSSGYVL